MGQFILKHPFLSVIFHFSIRWETSNTHWCVKCIVSGNMSHVVSKLNFCLSFIVIISTIKSQHKSNRDKIGSSQLPHNFPSAKTAAGGATKTQRSPSGPRALTDSTIPRSLQQGANRWLVLESDSLDAWKRDKVEKNVAEERNSWGSSYEMDTNGTGSLKRCLCWLSSH